MCQPTGIRNREGNPRRASCSNSPSLELSARTAQKYLESNHSRNAIATTPRARLVAASPAPSGCLLVELETAQRVALARPASPRSASEILALLAHHAGVPQDTNSPPAALASDCQSGAGSGTSALPAAADDIAQIQTSSKKTAMPFHGKNVFARRFASNRAPSSSEKLRALAKRV